MVVARTAAVALAGALIACASIGGLTGGGQPDASADASAPDAAGPPADAGLDSPGDPDAAAACGAATFLCDNFDDDAALAPSKGWTNLNGVLAIATDDFVSAPASLLVNVLPPTTDGGTTLGGFAEVTPSDTITSFRCDFDIALEGFGDGSATFLHFAENVQDAGLSRRRVGLSFADAGVTLWESGDPGSGSITTIPFQAGWNHLSVFLDLGAKKVTVTSSAGTVLVPLQLFDQGIGFHRQLDFGDYYTGGAAGRVHVDNVACSY